MITVQPIRYTSRPEQWQRLAHELGFTPAFAPSPGWSEFDGCGILAIHHGAPGSTLDGTTDLHVLVDDLASTEMRLRAAGVETAHTPLEEVGDMLTVTAGSGIRITVSAPSRAALDSPIAVLPIWYQADLEEPRRIFEALGLRPRIASDSGTWIDFTADGGGLAALHRAETAGIELSCEYTEDLDALVERLQRAGFEASIVDEAYNRTALVASPDGTTLWVNGPQEDLYGYTRAD